MSKKKLLIFEGCDCTGKSTLINKLFPDDFQQERNINVIHNGLFDSREDAFEEYTSQIIRNNDRQITLVLDRSYISELIYGKVLRNQVNKDWHYDTRNLESFMLGNFDPLIVHCHIPFQTMVDKWKARDEYVKNIENIERIYNEYERIQDHTILPIVKFDYTKKDLSYIKLVRKLIL